jgi:hypothetical protein
MSGFRLQSDWFRRRFSAATLAAAFALFAGVTLVVIPAIRAAEVGEVGSAKERGEDPPLTSRFDQGRQLGLEYRCFATLRSCPAPQVLGHAQRPILQPPSGHRLPNGLLAPLTC